VATHQRAFIINEAQEQLALEVQQQQAQGAPNSLAG